MIEAETASNARSRRSNFGGNWINGLDGAGWSQRRRQWPWSRWPSH